MNMTNDLLHEKRGEKKRQIKFPKGKKDTEDPKNRTRTKTNRAKTKRHKKTRKTSTKRPRRRGGGNGSLENFNLNFTISAGKHFQHHLHHRLKKNGEEKRPSRTTPSTWTRPSGTEIRSRRAAKITNVQLKLTPGNFHFRHPQLELQDLCMSCTHRKRLQCRGEGERHSFSDNNLSFNHTTDRAPPVLKRPEYLDEDLSGNHYVI